MLRILIYPINIIIHFFEGVAEYVLLMTKMFRSVKSWNLYLGFTADQMVTIGAQSIPIVMLTSLFSEKVFNASITAAALLLTTKDDSDFVNELIK